MMKQVEAANLILGQAGPSATFSLRWLGFTIKYSIKPLTVRRLIMISKEIAQMQELPDSGTVFRSEVVVAENLSFICKAIAIASGTFFVNLTAYGLSKLSLSDIQKLWATVIAQSDPDSFFFIMVSAKGVNKLRPNKSEVATQSSADSH